MRHSLVPLFAIALLASPLAAQAPAITCKDGSTSTASGRGACSGHGGVDKAATARAEKSAKAERKAQLKAEKTAQKTVKAEQKAEVREAAKTGTKVTHAPTATASSRAEDHDPTGAIAQCKDGLYSHATSRRGACSRHNGVAKWMP